MFRLFLFCKLFYLLKIRIYLVICKRGWHAYRLHFADIINVLVVIAILKVQTCTFSYKHPKRIYVAHKDKHRLNRQIVIIHEIQLSEILTIADFYCNAQIINPSIKPIIT